MSRENPGWGAPRIHGELLKLGIDIGETSVSKYLVNSRKPPSQTWRTFLENHLQSMVSVDFFSAPQRRRSPVGEGPTPVVVGRTG
jgi:putative transposase